MGEEAVEGDVGKGRHLVVPDESRVADDLAETDASTEGTFPISEPALTISSSGKE